MTTRFVSRLTTSLFLEPDSDEFELVLIRGDQVELTGFTIGDRSEVVYRRRTAWVATDHLAEQAILETYFIDVGQGDATLIVTPGRKTILIDGGRGQHALQFLMWRHRLDLDDSPAIDIDLLVLSRGDRDHIKGLIPLVEHERINVHRIVHNGLATYRAGVKDTQLGDTETVGGIDYIVDRVPDLAALEALDPADLSTDFRNWRQAIIDEPSVVAYDAVDQATRDLDIDDATVTLEVVGPLMETPGGAVAGSALRSFGSKKKTTNGHSVVLRLNHDGARFLFTGDVNSESGEFLAADAATRDLLDAHVLKAPHHGSHEFDLDFLRMIHPQMTVVSSGEVPDYGHPRPNFMGTVGRVSRGEDPLLFSTELAAAFKTVDVNSDDAVFEALRLDDPSALGTARQLWMKRLSGIINIRSAGGRLFAFQRVTPQWGWVKYDKPTEPRD